MEIYLHSSLDPKILEQTRSRINEECSAAYRRHAQSPKSMSVIVDPSGAMIPDFEQVDKLPQQGYAILRSHAESHQGGYVWRNHLTGTVNWIVFLSNTSVQSGFEGAGFDGFFYRSFLQPIFEQVIVPETPSFLSGDIKSVAGVKKVVETIKLQPLSGEFGFRIRAAGTDKTKQRQTLEFLIAHAPGGAEFGVEYEYDEKTIVSQHPQLTIKKKIGSDVPTAAVWKGGTKAEVLVEA